MAQIRTPPTRRERQREATYDEIVAVSAELLAEGADLSLRAVAARMGMTAPALYRYVANYQELVDLVAVELDKAATGEWMQAVARYPADDAAARLTMACVSFRRWALTKPREFALVFANPIATGDFVEIVSKATAAGATAVSPNGSFSATVISPPTSPRISGSRTRPRSESRRPRRQAPRRSTPPSRRWRMLGPGAGARSSRSPQWPSSGPSRLTRGGRRRSPSGSRVGHSSAGSARISARPPARTQSSSATHSAASDRKSTRQNTSHRC